MAQPVVARVKSMGIGFLIALAVFILALIKAFGGLPGLAEIWFIVALALAIML